jgi:ketosteroid isomerase-like protein
MPEESMTSDLVDLLRGGYEAGNRRDFDAVWRFFSPDGVWDLTPMGMGVYEGRAQVRSFVEAWWADFDEFRADPTEVLDLGNGVTFAVIDQKGRPLGSSGEVRMRYADVSTHVDGLKVRVVNYLDIDEARAAAERLAKERG